MSQTWPEFLVRYQTIPKFQTKADLNRSNCHKCENCVHEDVDMHKEPCVSCCWIYPPNRRLESMWESVGIRLRTVHRKEEPNALG